MITHKATCCSVVLSWEKYTSSNGKDIKFKLYQNKSTSILGIKEFDIIYEGTDYFFEVKELNPNTYYTFKLEIKANNRNTIEEVIEIKILFFPSALLSKESLEITNVKRTEIKKNISDEVKKIIGYCSKIIYDNNESNKIKGEIEGVIINITHCKINNNDIYYLFFDLETNYFKKFVTTFIDNTNKNVNLPCYFIFEKITTHLIFKLLQKGAVIFTGKLFGGVIASSFAFSKLNIGKKLNKKFNNAFNKIEKNNIGVVTFGSPSFINNGLFGFKEKEFIPYFCNIKDELDYFPKIIDFINKKKKTVDKLLDILQQKKYNNNDLVYLEDLNRELFTEKNISNHITNFKKISFGNYFMLKQKDCTLKHINEEKTFKDFYYKENKDFNSICPSEFKYRKLKLKEADLNLETLYYLKESSEIEHAKIIRRYFIEEGEIYHKGIIKLKLNDK